MFQLADELSSVTDKLDEADIPYALVGEIAYSLWVDNRNTQDIDFLIKPGDWENLAAHLSGLGYEPLADPMDSSSIRIRRLTKLAEKRVFIHDFLFADTDYLAQGVEQAVLLAHGGRRLKVANPEVIVHLKKARMSPLDQIDIENLQ